MMFFVRKIKKFLLTGHERSVAAKKNIMAMFFLKGASILISLILVPLTINYVDTEIYGLWIAISSVVAWIGIFDIGINNGLRNRFAEAKAKNNNELAQCYVSTAYAMLSFIFIPILLIFIIVNQQIDWSKVFNVNSTYAYDLSIAMVIVVSYFCLKFILSTINIILIADQKPANSSFRTLCENIASLFVILLLLQFTEGSIIKLTIALCVVPLLVSFAFNISLFRCRYRLYRPKITKVKFSLLPNLLSIGFRFFVIQLAMLIQFQTSSLIIIRNFGGDDVTLYNVTYKYFSVLLMIYTILITPLWSSSTEAYAKSDFSWIKESVRKYNRILAVFFIIGILMLIVSNFVFDTWLGDGVVNTSFTISLFMLFYVYSLMIGRVEGSILNGIGALKIQMYSAIISPIVFVMLVYVGIFLELGLYSLLIAGIISNFNSYLLAPLQYKRIFKDNSKQKIWYA